MVLSGQGPFQGAVTKLLLSKNCFGASSCTYYSQSGNGQGYGQSYGGGYKKSYGNTYGNGYNKGYGNSYGSGGYGNRYGNGPSFNKGNGNGGGSFYKKSWSGNKFGAASKPALPVNQFYYTDYQADGKNVRLKLDFGNVIRNPEESGNNPMKLVLTRPAAGETPAKVNEFLIGWKGAGQILALDFRDAEAKSAVEPLTGTERASEDGSSHARIGQNKGHLMVEVTSPEGEPIRCRVPPAQGIAIQALLK
ncbi:hypothetical protein FOL47_001021 [Perkinsus chesapeaki]|uniref:Uncharacterized protein n=1 Tax=Perkinsus chesapeaki TaxID=330153 RepID=A0A7J6MLC8_PERCH|nr:hypothetical protein FOL47_001021 [Perkinsus chesapeaki]